MMEHHDFENTLPYVHSYCEVTVRATLTGRPVNILAPFGMTLETWCARQTRERVVQWVGARKCASGAGQAQPFWIDEVI